MDNCTDQNYDMNRTSKGNRASSGREIAIRSNAGLITWDQVGNFLETMNMFPPEHIIINSNIILIS